jgi:hypothetical protein
MAVKRSQAWCSRYGLAAWTPASHCPQLDVPTEAAELILGFTA